MNGLQLSAESASTGSHLAFALFWLPAPRRQDALLFYRFCRTIDDIADEPEREESEKCRLLERWLQATEFPAELEEMMARYAIDRELLKEIIHGCAMDVRPRRFNTYAELEAYCWRVACAVGLASVRIFGCQSVRSDDYAVHLGHALQLTNIIRDVGEDAQRGRIYLPLEDLEQFGVTEQDIINQRHSAPFQELMKFQACRAWERFAAAVPDENNFDALLPARIMKAIYEKILHRLETQNFPVFGPPLRLGSLQKLTTALAVSFQTPPR